ncbi:hypothetical protein MRX96_022601 [Rhipicephalus microplus]
MGRNSAPPPPPSFFRRLAQATGAATASFRAGAETSAGSVQPAWFVSIYLTRGGEEREAAAEGAATQLATVAFIRLALAGFFVDRVVLSLYFKPGWSEAT